MSAILDKIADDLARTALKLEEDLGDLNVVDHIAKHIGTSSPPWKRRSARPSGCAAPS